MPSTYIIGCHVDTCTYTIQAQAHVHTSTCMHEDVYIHACIMWDSVGVHKPEGCSWHLRGGDQRGCAPHSAQDAHPRVICSMRDSVYLLPSIHLLAYHLSIFRSVPPPLLSSVYLPACDLSPVHHPYVPVHHLPIICAVTVGTVPRSPWRYGDTCWQSHGRGGPAI